MELRSQAIPSSREASGLGRCRHQISFTSGWRRTPPSRAAPPRNRPCAPEALCLICTKSPLASTTTDWVNQPALSCGNDHRRAAWGFARRVRTEKSLAPETSTPWFLRPFGFTVDLNRDAVTKQPFQPPGPICFNPKTARPAASTAGPRKVFAIHPPSSDGHIQSVSPTSSGGKKQSAHAPQVGQVFIPRQVLNSGVFVPDGLLACRLVSNGAKLCGRGWRATPGPGQCFPLLATTTTGLGRSRR